MRVRPATADAGPEVFLTKGRALADALRAGRWLIAIAVLHALFGLWFGRAAVAAIARDGFLDAVDGDPHRGLVFWFLLMSPLTAIVGQLVLRVARTGSRLPTLLGWELLLLTVTGVVLMPVPGFWLLLIPTGLLLRGQYGHRQG